MDCVFDILSEGFVEFVEIFFVFGDFAKEFNGFLYNVFVDDFKDFVLL